MNILGRLIHRVFRDFFFAKAYLFYRLYGVEYISEKLAICPRTYVVELLRRYGATIGKNTTFKNNILIDNPNMQKGISNPYANMQIGAGSYIGKSVYFDLFDQVLIGERCAISTGVKFITHANAESDELQNLYPRQQEKVIIGNGTWIGTNAIVLAGVELGKLCVVGAGAVVTESFPDYSVIGGVPARLIKTLSPK